MVFFGGTKSNLYSIFKFSQRKCTNTNQNNKNINIYTKNEHQKTNFKKKKLIYNPIEHFYISVILLYKIKNVIRFLVFLEKYLYHLIMINILQYTSDDQFMRAIIKNAELQSAHSDVYFYQFSYHGEIGQNNIVVPGRLYPIS